MTEPDTTALHDFIAEARWFGGKGREFTVGAVDDLGQGIFLARVDFTDGGSEVYTVPMSSYDEEQPRLAHALIGRWGGAFHYDAVHDREATRVWLESFAAGSDEGALAFHREPGHELDLETHSTLFAGEQSNSSMAFGEDSLLKLFRRVTPGVNPDIEIHQALTRAGSPHVAALYGWVSTSSTSRDGVVETPLQLGMLQQFLRTATDGWELALSSVRVLLAEADLHPDEAGGDFASEAHGLGVALAEVHAALREAFATDTLDLVGLSDRLRARVATAAAELPELEPHVETLDARFAALRGLAATGASVQRIHGDLHLGQTLRTVVGWKLVDFEGEPARPLAERLLPDSPWRDVAGMLRSFDYAARTAARDLAADPESQAQLDYRAQEWVGRARSAFLAGYADATTPLTQTDLALVEAYELDKAVYEVGYEARNRPTWVGIPLAALAGVGR